MTVNEANDEILDEGIVSDEASEPEADVEQQTDEAQAVDVDTDANADEAEADQQEGDDLAAQLADVKDRYVRLQAEWDNYRKRTAAERAQERSRATERLVTNLLPVVDDLDRAIEHVPQDADGEFKAFVEGVTGVLKKLNEVLAREKVSAVGEVGDAFDALKHQAVGKAEDASVPEETVVTVYQKGYEMAGKVLRPAMVIVSTGGGPREEPEQDGNE